MLIVYICMCNVSYVPICCCRKVITLFLKSWTKWAVSWMPLPEGSFSSWSIQNLTSVHLPLIHLCLWISYSEHTDILAPFLLHGSVPYGKGLCLRAHIVMKENTMGCVCVCFLEFPSYRREDRTEMFFWYSVPGHSCPLSLLPFSDCWLWPSSGWFRTITNLVHLTTVCIYLQLLSTPSPLLITTTHNLPSYKLP